MKRAGLWQRSVTTFQNSALITFSVAHNLCNQSEWCTSFQELESRRQKRVTQTERRGLLQLAIAKHASACANHSTCLSCQSREIKNCGEMLARCTCDAVLCSSCPLMHCLAQDSHARSHSVMKVQWSNNHLLVARPHVASRMGDLY